MYSTYLRVVGLFINLLFTVSFVNYIYCVEHVM